MLSKGPTPGNRGCAARPSGHSYVCLINDYRGWGFLLRREAWKKVRHDVRYRLPT